MPIYEATGPDGKTYDVNAPEGASQAEIKAYAKANYKGAQVQGGMGSNALKQIGAALTSPFRGYRGAAVGLENLVRHPTRPGDAMIRAGDATQVGFHGKDWPEKIAGGIGETVPLMPLTGALSAGGLAVRAGKAAMLGASLSAANQAAEEGQVTPGQTALAAGLSAVPELAIGGAKAAMPAIAGAWTKRPAAAYEVTSAFKKMFSGSPEAVEGQASKAAPALQELYDRINGFLRAKREYLGMRLSPKEALAEMEQTGGEPQNLSKVAKDFRNVKRNSAPFYKEKVESPLLGPNGKPIIKEVVRPGLSQGEKLRKLDEMAMDINRQTGGHYQPEVLQSKKAIEQEATKVGGAGYRLLKLGKQAWGTLEEIRKDMGVRLSDPVSSATELTKLVRKQLEDPTKWTGADEAKLAAIRSLEKLSGKSIIDPLKNEILSSYTNANVSPFIPKGMLGKFLLFKEPIAAMGAMLGGSPKVMGALSRGLANPDNAATAARRVLTPVLIKNALQSVRKEQDQQAP